MKVLVLFMCALASAAAGDIVAWPGAIPIAASQVKTIIPGQVKGFGYSTSQYINAITSAPFGYQPQFSYQISIPSYHPAQPVVGASYFPLPISPVAPAPPNLPGVSSQPPIQNIPSESAEQPAGDEDSAVIESADSLNQQNSQSSSSQASQSSLDTKNMPGFPQIPQGSPQIPQFPQKPQLPNIPMFPPFSQLPQHNPSLPQFSQGSQQNPSFPQYSQGSPQNPSFPQLSQGSQQNPSFPQISQESQQNPLFPQFPQGSQQNPSIPQFPQGSQVIPFFPPGSSFPQFPQYPFQQNPAFPQFPQYQQPGLISQQPQMPGGASFPSGDNSNKGLNDEDTISVESA